LVKKFVTFQIGRFLEYWAIVFLYIADNKNDRSTTFGPVESGKGESDFCTNLSLGTIFTIQVDFVPRLRFVQKSLSPFPLSTGPKVVERSFLLSAIYKKTIAQYSKKRPI
jgi:hypothetical protein